MRRTILRIAGSALIVVSAVQLAAASEHHQGRMHYRAAASTQFRDSNADAARAYVAVQPEWYRYSGGYSAPAGR
jgi:hypothetical protein